MVLLPVVFLLGMATNVHLVRINTEEFQLVLAMNRPRRAYLTLEPGLERYLTTGHHDDERGVLATHMAEGRPTRRSMWVHPLITTPTLVATVDAALAGAIAVLGLHAAHAPTAAAAVSAVAAFMLVWAALFRLQQTLDPLRHQTPRFPTPPDRP